MGRPRKEHSRTSHFSVRLQEYIDSRRAGTTGAPQRVLAEEIGLSAPQLSKFLTSEGPISADGVAQVCGAVAPNIAFQLLRAYLLDHAEVVFSISQANGFRGFRPSAKTQIVIHIEPRIELVKQ